MLTLHWGLIFWLRLAFGFDLCDILCDCLPIGKFYSGIAILLVFGVNYELCPFHIIPPLVRSLSCSFLIHWTIKEISLRHLLSKVLLQLLSKLKTIFESTVIITDLNVPLKLLLLCTSFGDEEKPCAESYSCKISDGLSVIPQESV